MIALEALACGVPVVASELGGLPELIDPGVDGELVPPGDVDALPQMIEELNGHLTGWANYFSYGYPRKGFRQINTYVRQRLTRHVRRRSQRPFRPANGVSYYEHFDSMGLVCL